VDISDYRGCGKYILDRVDIFSDECFLMKTDGECGDLVPYSFSDAPANFYEDWGMMRLYHFFDFESLPKPLKEKIGDKFDASDLDQLQSHVYSEGRNLFVGVFFKS
jgi:hypothetical protein